MKQAYSNLKWLLISASILFFDLLSKMLIVKHFTLGKMLSVLPFLNLTLAYNRGTAFSFLNQGLQWQFWFLTTLAIMVSVAILIYLFFASNKEVWNKWGLALILGGALGNLWDRLSLGVVVDFIDFHIGNWHFATFNLADASITIGACILVMVMFFSRENEE